MAMKRTASDILAEQHWKRRLLTNELTTTSEYEVVTRVNGSGYTNCGYSNDIETAVQKESDIAPVKTESLQCTSDAQPYDVEFPITQHIGGITPVIDSSEGCKGENASVIEHGENYNKNHENIQGDPQSIPIGQLQVSVTKPNNTDVEKGADPAFETITALQRDREQNSEVQVVISQVEQIPADAHWQDTSTLTTAAVAMQEITHGHCSQPLNVTKESCTNAKSFPATCGEQNKPPYEEEAPRCKTDKLNSTEQLEYSVPPQEGVNAQNAEIQETHISMDYSQDCSHQSKGHGNGHIETRHTDDSESTLITNTGSQCDTGQESQTIYSIMQSGNIVAMCDHTCNTPATANNEVDSTELLQTKAREIYSSAEMNERFQNEPHEDNEQPKHTYQAFEVTSSGGYSNANQMQSPEGIFQAIQPTATYETLEPMQAQTQMANSNHFQTHHSATALNFYGVEQHSALNSMPQGSVSTVSGYTESGPANPQTSQEDTCSSMNYQPYIGQGQAVSSHDSNDRGYDQPHPESTPLPTAQTQFHPAGSHHYQGAAMPQPNSSSDQCYLKNEVHVPYPPEQKMPQTQQLPEGMNNCIPNFLNSKDYVHDGSPSSGCQRQLPELMLHQNYLTGTETSKENFDAGPNKANYHDRQALPPMNVPPQFWSAPHYGTPICSSKPYGPPRHYRPPPYTFPVCSCTPSPINMPSCRSCHVGHNQMTPRSRHPRSFNSSYTEYSCREEHKLHSRRSVSCCHIAQHMPNDGSVYADDPNYVMTPGIQPMTPTSRAKQMGDFSAEGARFYNRSFRSNSWHSFSSDMSSDSESPMITSRAQPGLGSSLDYETPMERQVAPNSLSNPNNPVFRNLPPPGLERTKFLVSTYIDYLTEENERITDMSKAFTPPTYLFLEEEQYVLQAHKNESPFPSNGFSKWIKQYFPQVDAISVPEGKSNGNTTNISKLNLSEKSFDEFAHIVFFGCQDMQEKRKVVPVQTPVPTQAPMLAQPVAGN